MKKLFGRGHKSASHGPLCNKTVQVGRNTVLCEALLGSGGYADIYRVTDTASGTTYALKHLRLNGDPQLIVEVQREAKTQARLKGHPNVLRLHAVAFAGPKGGETDGFFLLDYCPGNLLDLLARHAFVLEERTVLHIFGCVARAVGHMHAQKPPMAHRDLKAENVLMLPDGTWVLCDYGSSTTRAQVYDTAEAMAAEEEVISKHTTPAYRPPEMWDLYQRQLIDTKVDIWALGVLLFVLCFGRLPFAGDSKLQILNGKYEMPATPSRAPQLRALIRSMLTLDPAQRPAISQVMQQLDQAALAITGKAMPAPTAAAAAQTPAEPAPARQPGSNQPAAPAQPAPTPVGQHAVAQQQQQQQQQHQQQPRQLQQPPAAAVGGSGSFWSTADVAGTQQHHSTAAPAASTSSSSSAPQQQHWAQFGPEASQPQHAVQRVQQQQLQADSSPQGSPVRAGPAAAATPSSNGCPNLPAAVQQGNSSNKPAGHVQQQQQQQQYHHQQQQRLGPDMGRLADITVRAQAAAATTRSSQPAAGGHHQQQQQQQHPAGRAAGSALATEPPVILERQSRPYSTGSTAGSAAGTPRVAAAAAGVDEARQLGDSSSRGSRAAAVPVAAEKRQPPPPPQQQQRQQQQPPQISSTASSAALSRPAQGIAAEPAVAAAVAAADTHSTGVRLGSGASASNRPACADPAAADAASGPAAGAGDAALLSHQLAELRSSVLGEVAVLRGQVASLSDQNQAFVFRIKQLEDYAQRQEQAVTRLNQQLAELLQQQGCNSNHSNGLGNVAASGSGAAGVVRRGSDGSGAGVVGQAAVPGGSFWSTQSAVL